MNAALKVVKVVPRRRNAQELVAHARKLVRMLNSGECIGFVAVAVRPDGGTDIFTCGPDVPLLSSIGASAILHAHLLAKVQEV